MRFRRNKCAVTLLAGIIFLVICVGAWSLIQNVKQGMQIHLPQDYPAASNLEVAFSLQSYLLVLPILGFLPILWSDEEQPHGLRRAILVALVLNLAGWFVLLSTLFAILSQLRVFPPLGMH